MSRKPLFLATCTAAACMAALSFNASARDEPVVGTVGFAAIGALAGGPVGAAVGAVIGAVLGTEVSHLKEHGHHATVHRHRVHHHHLHYGYVEPPRAGHIAYIERTAYSSNGATAHDCPPERVVYTQRVVERARPVKVAQPAAKPKLKKVCKWVPARHTTTAARYSPPRG